MTWLYVAKISNIEVVYKALSVFSQSNYFKINMRTQAIVLFALLGAVAFAEPTLKQKLGQVKKLAQVQQAECEPVEASAPALQAISVDEPTLDWCECSDTLNGTGLGAGVYAANSLSAQVNQQTNVASTPDVSQTSECITNCCACNEANGEERINAQRVRHFCIAGDISVTEDIEYHQLSRAEEASAGRAHKESECVLNNQGSEDLGDICIDGVSACPDDGVTAGNPGSSSGTVGSHA